MTKISSDDEGGDVDEQADTNTHTRMNRRTHESNMDLLMLLLVVAQEKQPRNVKRNVEKASK